MPAATSVSNANDLLQILQPNSKNLVQIDGKTLPNTLLDPFLRTFNGGSQLSIAVSSPPAIQGQGVTMSGTVSLFNSPPVPVTAEFCVNGDFTVTATLPTLSLSKITSRIGRLKLPSFLIPTLDNFSLSSVAIQVAQEDGKLTLSAAVGNFALVAPLSATNDFDVALGFEVQKGGLSALPGLSNSPFAMLDRLVPLSPLLMVLSSYDEPSGFDFPDVGAFDGLAVGGISIALPGTGLQKGMNVYATVTGDAASGSALSLLAKRIGIKLAGVTVTASMDVTNPAAGTKLFLAVGPANVTTSVLLTGQLGGSVVGASLGGYFSGTALAPIQNTPVTFTLQALAAPTGVILGGSMQATQQPLTFKLKNTNTSFSISQLGIVIGINDDGVPSAGFAAMFDINQASIAAAVFFDSAAPSQSVFAASISNFNLYTIARYVASQADAAIPSAFQAILKQFNLTGTQSFTLPSTLGASLDGRDLPAISKAFSNLSTPITLPSTSDKVMLDVNTPGKTWYITDLTSQLHYSINYASGAMTGQLEPQFYFAPQDTNIGGITFKQDCYINGQLDLYLLKTKVKVAVTAAGLLADLYVDPISLFNKNFFSVTAADSDTGPHISIATMSQQNLADANLRSPHVLISGQVMFLGATLAKIYMYAGVNGQGTACLIVDLEEQVYPWLNVSVSGSIATSAALSLSGTVTIGYNETFSLGALGTFSLASVSPSLSMSYANGQATAQIAGTASIAEYQVSFSKSLDVNAAAEISLFSSQAAMKAVLHDTLQQAFNSQLLTISQWIAAVQQGAVTISSDITATANYLATQMNSDYVKVGNTLVTVGFSAYQIYNWLVSTQGTAQAAATLSSLTGISRDQINSIVSYNSQSYQAAKTTLASIESAVTSAGNTVINWLDGLVGKSTGSSSADSQINAALDSPSLKSPALNMQQFKSLAKITADGGNDTLILGVGTDNMPYLVTWMHARGHGWKGGRLLPYPAVPGFALNSVRLAVASNGDAEVLGLGTDGTPYLVSYMGSGCYSDVLDRRQGWNAGMALPCPAGQAKFTALAHGLSSSGDLEIVGIGQDQKAYLVSYLTASHIWQPGIPLPCPSAQSSFTSIAVSASRNGTLHIYGIGVDQLPYRIAYLDGSGWHGGEQLPTPSGQNHFRNLYGASPNGHDLSLYGLGVDGLPYTVAAYNGSSFQAGMQLPVPQGYVFKSLEAAGGIANGDLQVFCLGMNNQIYLGAYLVNGASSYTQACPLPCPAQESQFQSLSYTLASTGDAEVAGLGMDGKPYIVTYNGQNGWQPGACMNIS